MPRLAINMISPTANNMTQAAFDMLHYLFDSTRLFAIAIVLILLIRLVLNDKTYNSYSSNQPRQEFFEAHLLVFLEDE
ncbi:MAG: hypothetical protein AAFY91_00725 [Bacteroidota bacterium]